MKKTCKKGYNAKRESLHNDTIEILNKAYISIEMSVFATVL